MDIQNTLSEIHAEIDRCYFVSCFDMSSGLPVAMAGEKYRDSADSISAAFGQMLDLIIEGQRSARNDLVRQLLCGFHELILETDRSAFFIMLPDNSSNYAVAVGVPVDVKIGYARLVINRHGADLASSLSELTS